MLLGITLSALSALSCNFLSYEQISDSDLDPFPAPLLDAKSAKIGFFRYEITDGSAKSQCKSYDYSADGDGPPEEANFNVANNGAVVSVIFAMLAVVFFLLASFEKFRCCCACCTDRPRLWITVFCGLATACQGVTFMIFGFNEMCDHDERECSIGPGAYLSGIAATLYLFCGVLVVCTWNRLEIKPSKEERTCGIEKEAGERDEEETIQ